MRVLQPVIMFDLGETLFKPLPPEFGRQNLVRWVGEQNKDVNSSTLHRVFAKVKQDVATKFALQSFFLHKDFIAEVYRQTCDQLNLHSPNEAVEGYCESQRLSVINHLKPRHDALSTLKVLMEQDKRLAIVSNIDNDWLDPLIEKWELSDWMSMILSSETARSCKPDQLIFELGCSRMEVEPSEVVFVGDDEVNDVDGGNQAGMTTIRFQGNQPSPTQANWEIQSLSELIT